MGVTSAKPKLRLQLLCFLASIDSGFGGPRCHGNSPAVAQSPSPGALPPTNSQATHCDGVLLALFFAWRQGPQVLVREVRHIIKAVLHVGPFSPHSRSFPRWVEGLVENPELGKFRGVSRRLTPESPYSGPGQASASQSPRCSRGAQAPGTVEGRLSSGSRGTSANQVSPPLLSNWDLGGVNPSAALCW